MEAAWLIELKQSVSRTPMWYGETDEGVLGATSDHMKAIRFARKWDAEMVLADIGWTEAFVCEHAWDATAPRRRLRSGITGIIGVPRPDGSRPR